MTTDETFMVINYLRAAYPTFYSRMDAQAVQNHVKVWADIFREYPVEAVKAGVKAFVSAENTAFPPAPGQVIEYIFRAQNPGNRSALQAWAEVRRAVNSPRDQMAAAFGALPEIVQAVLKSPDTLTAWGNVSENDFETVVQAAFLRNYEAAVRRMATDQRLPERMRIQAQTPEREKLPEPRPIEYDAAFDATETRYGEAVKTALDGLKNRLRGNSHVD